MNDLITVFRMTEIKPETRAKIIIRLGRLINDQYGSNITEALVYELVSLLDHKNPILQNEHYLYFVKEQQSIHKGQGGLKCKKNLNCLEI